MRHLYGLDPAVQQDNLVGIALADCRLLEVHIDGENAVFPEAFNRFLAAIGFDPDPFSVNSNDHNSLLVNHWTGRVLVPKNVSLKPIASDLRQVSRMVVAEGRKYGLRLYVEVELIRGDLLAADMPASEYSLEDCLRKFCAIPSGQFGGAAADIHVEFAASVRDEVEELFTRHLFYPVTGVDHKDGQAYVVYTMQTEHFVQGQDLYRALVRTKMHGIRGITLEQKLSMEATVDDLLMPEVISVTRW